MRKTIILITNFYPPNTVGGAEIVAHRQAKLLTRNGWQVVVLAGAVPTTDAPTGSISSEVYEQISVYRISIASQSVDNNFRFPPAGRLLTSLIATYQPDWVHLHNPIGLGADLISLAKSKNIPVAVTLHDGWGFCFKNTRLRNDGTICEDYEQCSLCQFTIPVGRLDLHIRMRRDFVAYNLAQADVLVSPSNDLRSAYARAGFGHNIKVISNGIDIAAVQPRRRAPTGTVRFLCSAYLGEHKGLLVLLDALELLAKEVDLHRPWHLAIAGHGHLEKVIRQQIAKKGLGQFVTLLGRLDRTELLSIMTESDVVILPSIWPENEPVSMLEGIASGAALVASDIGGIPSLVIDGVSGLLCPPGDSHRLMQALKTLINSTTLIEQMSAANIDRRPQLDEEISFRQMEDIFSSVVERHGEETPLVVICGGMDFDQNTAVFVDLLALMFRGRQVRLIWHEWADEAMWQAASAFWWWSKIGGLNEIEDAIRRGVPVAMREGAETTNIKRIVPDLAVYRSANELIDILSEFYSSSFRAPDAPGQRALRFYDILREKHHFCMTSEG